MKLFSADSHVNEPPEAWERVPKVFRDRGPRIVRNPPGLKGLYQVIDGMQPEAVGVTFLAGKDREAGNFRKHVEDFEWDDWKGPWDPAERLKDMDLDDVETEVLYPSMARNLYALSDVLLQNACLRAYNEWLNDYCLQSPKRLLGLAMLSALDIEWSTKELGRCASLGFRGAILPSALPEGQSYASQRFDPLWEVAQDLGLPICFHENTPQGRERAAVVQAGKLNAVDRGRSRIRAWIEPQITLVDLIFGRVLERFPSLQFVFAEYELCWVGIVLKTDRAAGRSRSLGLFDQTPTSLPSEYIRRQVHVTFQQDRIGILGIEVFGLDNYMWSSDYPHGGSSWPKSQQSVEAVLRGLPVEAQRKLLWENGAKLYGLGE